MFFAKVLDREPTLPGQFLSARVMDTKPRRRSRSRPDPRAARTPSGNDEAEALTNPAFFRECRWRASAARNVGASLDVDAAALRTRSVRQVADLPPLSALRLSRRGRSALRLPVTEVEADAATAVLPVPLLVPLSLPPLSALWSTQVSAYCVASAQPWKHMTPSLALTPQEILRLRPIAETLRVWGYRTAPDGDHERYEKQSGSLRWIQELTDIVFRNLQQAMDGPARLGAALRYEDTVDKAGNFAVALRVRDTAAVLEASEFIAKFFSEQPDAHAALRSLGCAPHAPASAAYTLLSYAAGTIVALGRVASVEEAWKADAMKSLEDRAGELERFGAALAGHNTSSSQDENAEDDTDAPRPRPRQAMYDVDTDDELSDESMREAAAEAALRSAQLARAESERAEKAEREDYAARMAYAEEELRVRNEELGRSARFASPLARVNSFDEYIAKLLADDH